VSVPLIPASPVMVIPDKVSVVDMRSVKFPVVKVAVTPVVVVPVKLVNVPVVEEAVTDLTVSPDS